MSIQQRSLALASAPALAVYERVPQESGRRGTILFYHGFGASKDQFYVELYTLAAAAIIADRRIQAAAPVVGSPVWKLPWRESPHLYLARFFPTALLSQMARADTRVPSQAVRAFHDRLAPYYMSAPERLHLIEYPHVDHDLCEEDWIQVRQNLVAWFERFLIGEEHV